MKRGALLTLVTLTAGLVAFGVTRLCCPPASAALTDDIAWIRTEFHLSPAQTAAVEKLHDDYFPICMEHCRLVAQARAAVASASAAELPAVQAELLRLQTVCQDATRAHLQRVAAAMPPDQGARFLSLVLPKLSHLDHHAPLGLQ